MTVARRGAPSAGSASAASGTTTGDGPSAHCGPLIGPGELPSGLAITAFLMITTGKWTDALALRIGHAFQQATAYVGRTLRFTLGGEHGVVLTSKLIDGTFPDYARVIPTGNDKRLTVDCAPFKAAVDRVSTISSDRGRAVKLALADGRMTLSVNNPDSGSAVEEIEVDYDASPLDIGFNARYLLDITQQLDSDTALFKLADPGSPTVIQDRDGAAALYVLMPMRV